MHNIYDSIEELREDGYTPRVLWLPTSELNGDKAPAIQRYAATFFRKCRHAAADVPKLQDAKLPLRRLVVILIQPIPALMLRKDAESPRREGEAVRWYLEKRSENIFLVQQFLLR